MKPKAILLGGKVAYEVYDTAAVSRIKKSFDIEPVLFDIKNNVSDAEYIFSTWGMPELTEEEIKEKLPNLKAVFYAAGTVQYFARPFLSLGIRVFSAWAANAVPVAEFTFAQILLANKGYFHNIKGGERKRKPVVVGNYHTKIGILGAGMIGKLVIDRLKTTDLDVLVYDPFISDEYLASRDVKRATLNEIFSECNVISNHIANLPATVGMLDYSLFSKMDDNAVFINTGRGAQVIEDDLIRALKEKPSRTALLDVTHPEPTLPDSELRTLPNVILSPHIGGSMGSETPRMAQYMAEEAESLLSGKALRYEVTEKMLETMA